MQTTTTTPQPFHGKQSLADLKRNVFETELWDDNGDVIFAAEDDTLELPARVKCRVWITAQADTDTIGVFNILVNGVIVRTVNVIVTQTAQCHTYVDLDPGDHTITITATGTLTDPLIMARRGVRPSTI